MKTTWKEMIGVMIETIFGACSFGSGITLILLVINFNNEVTDNIGYSCLIFGPATLILGLVLLTDVISYYWKELHK